MSKIDTAALREKLRDALEPRELEAQGLHCTADVIRVVPALLDEIDAGRSTQPIDRDGVIEAMARAICAASSHEWRTNEGFSSWVVQNHPPDALNNHWRYKAQAALAAALPLLQRSDEVAKIMAWLRDRTNHVHPDYAFAAAFADAIERGDHRGDVG